MSSTVSKAQAGNKHQILSEIYDTPQKVTKSHNVHKRIVDPHGLSYESDHETSTHTKSTDAFSRHGLKTSPERSTHKRSESYGFEPRKRAESETRSRPPSRSESPRPQLALQSLLGSFLPPPSPATAYKRYTSVYPCASKLLAKKWDDAAHKRHLEKLRQMKARIDNSEPLKHNHLSVPSKKLQLKQGNSFDIHY